MRYLLIDRITEWKADQKIKGVKNVAMTEDFLEWHFPKNPVMPGVLLIEAFAQLAGWLEAASSDFKSWFLITKVRQCKFYGFALPGDQVELDVERLTELGADKKVYSGVGKVEGKKNISIEFEGDIIPFQDIEELEEQKRFFKVLTRKP
jgi:3-hydroxymyristoyl/3-hydroxydecanoyl-(acyl carrier protein) dehydratase